MYIYICISKYIYIYTYTTRCMYTKNKGLAVQNTPQGLSVMTFYGACAFDVNAALFLKQPLLGCRGKVV